MSIQTYINKLADTILYRCARLNRFTDHIFIPIGSISLPSDDTKRVIYYENKADTYELCDIINSITEGGGDYSWASVLLLLCPEHEPVRKLKTVVLPKINDKI